MARMKSPACPGCGLIKNLDLPWREVVALAAGQVPPRQAAPSLTGEDLRVAVTGWCRSCYRMELTKWDLEVEGLIQIIREQPAFVIR